MNDFVDTRSWPLAHLHMPLQVSDNQAAELLAQIESLHARAEPFALLMDGAELPRHSPRFMQAYTQWSRDNFALQQRYCVGAVRIEADETLRREYAEKAQAWEKSGPTPYPYHIVATNAEAEALAHVWLAAWHQPTDSASSPLVGRNIDDMGR